MIKLEPEPNYTPEQARELLRQFHEGFPPVAKWMSPEAQRERSLAQEPVIHIGGHLATNPTHFHWCAQCDAPLTCACDNDRRRGMLCLECGGEADFNRKMVLVPEAT